jgi:hypothetical protein
MLFSTEVFCLGKLGENEVLYYVSCFMSLNSRKVRKELRQERKENNAPCLGS